MTSPATALPPPRPHLSFLDGLRGLTAVYVMFCHSDSIVKTAEGVPHIIFKLLGLTSFGHYAVAIFIVLSGYCLMLPVASTPDGRLRGGVWQYLRRRAMRILPPYYIALGVSLLLCLIPLYHRHNGEPTGLATDSMFPAFGMKNIIAHLLLLHNFNLDYVIKINSPFWSVAPEWQIYFLFPAILLPVWRRFGEVAVVGAAFFLSMIPHFFFAGDNYLDWTAPWYLGLFSLGMVGAIISRDPGAMPRVFPPSMYHPRLWLAALLVSAGALFAICRYAFEWQVSHYWITDPLTGIATISLILWCVLSNQRNHRPWIMRLLESRVMVGLGTFSYSLYLIHFPVLGLMNQALLRLNPSPVQRLWCVYFLFCPLTIAIAYLFFYFFERPFLSQNRSKKPTGSE